MRGATTVRSWIWKPRRFLLTRLMRGAISAEDHRRDQPTISTHAPHARRDVSAVAAPPDGVISTHAPHARRDDIPDAANVHLAISTHAPHARRDAGSASSAAGDAQFLLTRLMRGATYQQGLSRFWSKISTHAPHARRDSTPETISLTAQISTHAPHARRDENTESAWIPQTISTHAPHARRDP